MKSMISLSNTERRKASNLNVLSVSSKLISAGDNAAIIAVFELPPRFSRRSHVSTESRYGITDLPLPFRLPV